MANKAKKVTRVYEVTIVSDSVGWEPEALKGRIESAIHPSLYKVKVVDKTPCEHDWSEWSYAVSPSGRRSCKKCGKVDFD